MLPPGCVYLEGGDDSQTLVACSLSAADVLRGADDVKHVCREKYANDIVVHVEIPAASVDCVTSRGNPKYSANCSKNPWVVQADETSGEE
jgi:hypothetical protein